MNILLPDEPPLVRVAHREVWGVGDSLITLTLECGHVRVGQRSYLEALGDVVACRQCDVVVEPVQMELL